MDTFSDSEHFSVAGLRVLVTGSSRGIGRAIALRLGAAGARVVLHGRDTERLESTLVEAEASGIAMSVVDGDLRDAEQVAALVERAAAMNDGLDAVVNNAGGSFVAEAADISVNGFNAILQTNLTSCFLASTAAFPYLREARGSLVNISSIASIRPAPTLTPYASAKAGMNQLTRSLAAEWAGTGVRVNAVLPGTIATQAALSNNYGDDPDRIAEAAERIGVGRLGEPDDIAHAVRYLLSPAASFVNGALLVVDGGPPDNFVV